MRGRGGKEERKNYSTSSSGRAGTDSNPDAVPRRQRDAAPRDSCLRPCTWRVRLQKESRLREAVGSAALALAVTVAGKPNDYAVQFLAIKFPFLSVPLPKQVIQITKLTFHLTIYYVFSLF